jgi:two-component system, NtrC family, response regulator AtoC
VWFRSGDFALIMEEQLYQQAYTLATPGNDEFPEAPLFEAISPSMRAVVAMIRELAHSFVPVLLIGEHGTGKRSIARRLHQNSGEADGNFCAKICRGLNPEELGLFVGTGTLYLADIGDLNAGCQGKFFDLLSRQGSNGSSRRELRVICGTSRDMEAEVRAGTFREDLYYRLSGVCLRIPPLRQRKEDVSHLMRFFLERYSTAYRRPIPRLSAPTEKLFLEYSWPGNLAELEAVARAMVAVGDESVAMGGLRSMFMRTDGNGHGEKMSLKEASRAASREAEREIILKALTRTRWNRRRAAQELQISYKALLYKLKQIGYGEYGAS